MRTTRRRFFGQLAGGAATLWALGCKREGDTAGPSDAAAAAPTPGSAAPPVPRVEDFPEKTLLVLGGTGFLGPHVVDAALAQGWKVTLFNRGKTNADLFPELEKLHGDRDGKLEALEGRRFRAVIDTSGYVPRIVRQSAELLAPNVAHYMFVSSISAYADFRELGITEDYPVAVLEDPDTEEVMAAYGGLKAACEAAVEATLPGRTINVRPGYIVGPRDPTDRFTYWPVRVDEGGEMLAPGTPDDPVQVIDVRDLAKWMIGALEQRHMGVYNLCGPVLPLGDVLEACKDHATRKPTLTWVDKEFLAAKEVEAGQIPIWVPPGEPGFEGFAQVSAQKAIDTGLTTRPLSETVRDTLTWWRELPEERRSKLRAGLSPEREKELLAAWNELHPRAKPVAKPGKPAKKKISHAGTPGAETDRLASRWQGPPHALLGVPA
jgi:2'-hydroxyisoflavone reductase